MTAVADLDLDDLLEVIEHEDHPVLVDFWTPTCAPCRTLKPHLDRFAEDRDEVRIVAVNAARETTAAAHFNVKAVPTLIVFEGGVEQERLTGAILPSKLEATIDRFAA